MKRLRHLLILAVALTCGCAKFPEGGGGPRSKRLTFSVTFSDDIRFGLSGDGRGPAYYYFVMIDTDANLGTGPQPIVGGKGLWGNGYAAGHYTYFVVIGSFAGQPSGQYVLYKVLDPDDGRLDQVVPVGSPVNVTMPQLGDRVLRFELDSSQFPDTSNPSPTFIQVNFIAVNRIPTDPNDDGNNRFWDALGSGVGGLNSYIKIPLDQDGVYNNASFGNFEQEGDVTGGPDPTVDIKDFSVQVSS